jgi:hypothetical protein
VLVFEGDRTDRKGYRSNCSALIAMVQTANFREGDYFAGRGDCTVDLQSWLNADPRVSNGFYAAIKRKGRSW